MPAKTNLRLAFASSADIQAIANDVEYVRSRPDGNYPSVGDVQQAVHDLTDRLLTVLDAPVTGKSTPRTRLEFTTSDAIPTLRHLAQQVRNGRWDRTDNPTEPGDDQRSGWDLAQILTTAFTLWKEALR